MDSPSSGGAHSTTLHRTDLQLSRCHDPRDGEGHGVGGRVAEHGRDQVSRSLAQPRERDAGRGGGGERAGHGGPPADAGDRRAALVKPCGVHVPQPEQDCAARGRGQTSSRRRRRPWSTPRKITSSTTAVASGMTTRTRSSIAGSETSTRVSSSSSEAANAAAPTVTTTATIAAASRPRRSPGRIRARSRPSSVNDRPARRPTTNTAAPTARLVAMSTSPSMTVERTTL